MGQLSHMVRAPATYKWALRVLLLSGLLIGGATHLQMSPGGSDTAGQQEQEMARERGYIMREYIIVTDPEEVVQVALWGPSRDVRGGGSGLFQSARNLSPGIWACNLPIPVGVTEPEGQLWVQKSKREGRRTWYFRPVSLIDRAFRVEHVTEEAGFTLTSPSGTLYFTYKSTLPIPVKVVSIHGGWVFGGDIQQEMLWIRDNLWLGVAGVYDSEDESTYPELQATFREYERTEEGDLRERGEVHRMVDVIAHIRATGR